MRKRWKELAALAALFILWLLACRAQPVGLVEDDALHILLAQALWGGAFALDGLPVTDPLPGFAFLLMLPAKLLEPNWEWLRLLNLPLGALALWGTRRLGGDVAAAALLLTPVFVERLGLITPDVAFVAAAVWALVLEKPVPAGLCAAAAALLRPQGFLLLPALLFKGKGGRLSAVIAAVPPALWLLRNKLAAGTPTGYLDNLGAQAASLASPGAWLSHAAALGSALGQGLTGVGLLWLPLFALAARGAVLRTNRGELAPAVYAVGVLALHLAWLAVEPRYVLPLAPVLWAFALESWKKPHWAAVLVLLPASFPRLAQGLREQARFQPKTMEWIRRNTPETAVFESLEFRALQLLSGRRARLPALDPAADTGATHAHHDLRFESGGYFPEAARPLLSRRKGRRVFFEPREGVEIFELK